MKTLQQIKQDVQEFAILLDILGNHAPDERKAIVLDHQHYHKLFHLIQASGLLKVLKARE